MRSSNYRFPLHASRLLRIQLDDQLLLCGDWNVWTRWTLQHLTAEGVAIDGDPRQRRAAARLIHRRHHISLLPRLHAHANLLTRLHEVARNVDRLLVDFDVTVTNELASCLAAAGESHPIHDVVETRFQRGEKIVSRNSRQRCDALKGVTELSFAHAVNALDLLLLTQLLRVLRHLATTSGRSAVLTGRRRTTLDRALLGEALGRLEKQLGSFATALSAARIRVTHRLDPPTLGRAAAIVRNRRDVLDRLDLQTSSDERLDRRLASRARTLHSHVHATNAERHRLTSSLLTGNRGSERSRLLRSLEASLSSRAPGDRVPLAVGDGDGGVVERRADVSNSFRFDYALCLFTNCHSLSRYPITWCINPTNVIQYRLYLVTFFLPAIARRGPFLVRPLVCVR